MKTNLQQTGHSANIPAGIFSNTELFAVDGRMYALSNGVRVTFEELPSVEKRSFMRLYMDDKDGQMFIQKHFGIVGFESGFKKWLFCKFGSLDGQPDSVDGRITPDIYNSACVAVNCPGRARFCGVVSGLKGYEVETLRELKAGKTAMEIANDLCLSPSAVKGRIERLKERFQVANVVALVAAVTELGI